MKRRHIRDIYDMRIEHDGLDKFTLVFCSGDGQETHIHLENWWVGIIAEYLWKQVCHVRKYINESVHGLQHDPEDC